MNTLKKFEAKELEKLKKSKNIPDFSAGDTIKVYVKVREGSRERIQAYEGVCIGRHGSGINASFTVRKTSYGEGVERVFPLYSTRIDSIELIRRGSVRRAKLYYLRTRRGKSARIAERTSGRGIEVREGANKNLKVGKAPKKEEPAKPESKKETGKAAAKKPAAKKKTETKKAAEKAEGKKTDKKT